MIKYIMAIDDGTTGIRSIIFAELRKPGTCIPESIICCAISLGERPLTSTQTFPKEMHRKMNITRYMTARNGSSIRESSPCGGESTYMRPEVGTK